MKKLLKEYGYTTNMQYYEMIAESFVNGQIKQAHEQFEAMPRSNRVEILQAVQAGEIHMSKEHETALFNSLKK